MTGSGSGREGSVRVRERGQCQLMEGKCFTLMFPDDWKLVREREQCQLMEGECFTLMCPDDWKWVRERGPGRVMRAGGGSGRGGIVS